jgi:AraC-like DNA-binding protein
LLKFALANIIAELHEPKWRVACADFGADRMAILLQPQVAEGRPPLAEAIETVSRLLKFSVSAGMSMPQSDVCKLKQAMLEAENALTYRLYRGYGQLVPFQDVSAHEVTDTQAPEDGIRELLAAVESGEGEKAVALLERIAGNIRSRYWYPTEALAALQSLLERLQGLCPGGEGAEAESAGRLATMYIEDIEAELTGLINALSERYRRLIGSKDFILCQRMMEYMEQHLGEPIGIPEIADSIGISSSLASQLFKQETNETIYNYLTRLRMERAGELLVKTDRKISDIALMVGYQHENSFIRSFRKFKDITPGKYRDMMRTRMDALYE